MVRAVEPGRSVPAALGSGASLPVTYSSRHGAQSRSSLTVSSLLCALRALGWQCHSDCLIVRTEHPMGKLSRGWRGRTSIAVRRNTSRPASTIAASDHDGNRKLFAALSAFGDGCGSAGATARPRGDNDSGRDGAVVARHGACYRSSLTSFTSSAASVRCAFGTGEPAVDATGWPRRRTTSGESPGTSRGPWNVIAAAATRINPEGGPNSLDSAVHCLTPDSLAGALRGHRNQNFAPQSGQMPRLPARCSLTLQFVPVRTREIECPSQFAP